jgi:hypothetical protein
VTDDDLVIMASESGVLPVPEHKIVRKWRLQPGKMFLIDLEQGRMVDDEEIKATLANSKPYTQWIENLRNKLDDVPTEPAGAANRLSRAQGAASSEGGGEPHAVGSAGALSSWSVTA